MKIPILCASLLGVLCFSLAAHLEPWFQSWQGNRSDSGNLLKILLGDSRRMFANHFFVKADVYFHSGYYPSIFDNREAFQTPHMAEDAGVVEGKNQGDEDSFLAPPRDWIDRFSRHFYPTHHTHLDQGGSGEGHADSEKGQEREILPWLKLSAELDPQQIETYTVSAYWLRERLNKVAEAEQFLRQGLRANPGSYEILYQLGVISRENHHDPAKARNLWELALRRWQEQESTKEDPDIFLFLQITSRLSLLEEEEAGHWEKALAYMKMWKTRSPEPHLIQGRIDGMLKKVTAPQPANPTSPSTR